MVVTNNRFLTAATSLPGVPSPPRRMPQNPFARNELRVFRFERMGKGDFDSSRIRTHTSPRNCLEEKKTKHD